MTPRASVIVRARDAERTVGRTLELLRAQTIEPEIVAVVDSRSRDRTREIAGRLCDELIDIPASEFSYGRALNVGARAASAPFHFALSAHCFCERRDWLERSLAHYERPDVAATNGIQGFPDFSPVREPFYQNATHAHAHPFWGFSNHASSWRAAVWEEFRFDERIDYAEDREWSWRVLDAGWVIAFDPELWVDISHMWRSSPEFFRRELRAGRAIATFASLPPYQLRDALHEWWTGIPQDRRPQLYHRLNYRRAAGLAGKYAGLRCTRR
jgi:rhamnosyltransferase